MDILTEIKKLVVAGHINTASKYPPDMADKPGVEELVQRAIEKKLPALEILQQALIPGMDIVGEKFSHGEIFVPEMLFSAKAMKAGVALLRPLLIGAQSFSAGKVILGTVQGDMHDIGKNLVAMMLEGAGFEIIDLGVNTSIIKFIESARSHPEAVVGLSALLSVTMEQMRDVIAEFRKNNLPNKIIIGGAPTSPKFASDIGADGYGKDATEAVKLAKSLIG